MCSDLSVQERVHAGATRLDRIKPGWASRVQHTLDIKSCRWCILGQVFGDFGIGMIKLFGENAGDGRLSMDHGFDTCHLGEIGAIHAYWREEIEARLHPPLVVKDQPVSSGLYALIA